MGKIEKILKKGPVEGQTTEVYPVTSTKAVYDENNKRLDNIITRLQESIYLNTPIPISTENTPESMAQNVKNIADYVEKAKAAGIANVDGMGVTCLINGGISGLGYIYVAGNSFELIGMTMWDDMVDNAFFIVREGEFNSRKIAFEGTVDTVTSDMLVEGARRPIILTPSTTEVDEETYQKLLSDDVDVVYNTINMTTKDIDSDKNITMTFSYAICAADIMQIASIDIQISSTSPHSVVKGDPVEQNISPKQVVNKSTLSPVLQEIDLRGTDAERKAKLDQFETDWKALTGAYDLTGARFVGKFGITDDVERNVTGIMTYSAGDTATDATDNCFYGICNGYSMGEQKSQIAVKVSCTDGSITITPLFSHLEAITIKTGNTPEDKAANVAAIKAYVDNLKALGIDTTKGYTIPIRTSDGIIGEIYPDNNKYRGFVIKDMYSYAIIIGQDGTLVTWFLLDSNNDYAALLTTDNKRIIPAINEVNALAKGYSTIFTPIELTTETAQNKTAIDARVAAFTAQGISLTNGCCIPVTYKGVYAGNISLINGDWYGLLVKNTNNPADNINIKLSADGTITEGNSVQ